MNIRRSTRATTTLAALVISLAAATAANAIDTCKVKVDKKTGVILADATNVGGPLLWGGASGQETNSFFNVGTCVVSGKAKKCQLADPLTLASKSSPSGCTLYLDDGVAACSAWIPGCSPGQRSSSGVFIKDSTGAVIGHSADSFGQAALREEAGVTVRLPVLTDGTGFNASGALYYVANDCSGTGLLPVDNLTVKSASVVSNSIGFYPPSSGTLQNTQSVLYMASFVDNQPECDSYIGPGTTFIAPHGCCFVTPFAAVMGTAPSVNLASFVPPFSVEVQ